MKKSYPILILFLLLIAGCNNNAPRCNSDLADYYKKRSDTLDRLSQIALFITIRQSPNGSTMPRTPLRYDATKGKRNRKIKWKQFHQSEKNGQ